MKKCFEIACRLELEVLNKIEIFARSESDSNPAYWSLVLNSQKQFLNLVEEAAKQEESFPEYPEIEPEAILVSKEQWQSELEQINLDVICQEKQLVALLMVEKFNENLQEFYQQASANVAHPLSKVFFSSLSELKNLQTMRLSMLSKVYNNKLWGILGYSPFYNN